MRLLALMVLLASYSAYGEEPDNYCNDAEANRQWATLLPYSYELQTTSYTSSHFPWDSAAEELCFPV